MMDRAPRNMLLLRCLRARTGAADNAPLECTTEGQWQELLQQAGRHGLKPLLYRRLEQAARISDVPDTVFQDLRQAYLLNAKRNIRLYRELAMVLASLRGQGIQAIVLKGAHLAEIVYQNLAVRPMADIDLLVRTTDLDRVQDVLVDIGYGPLRRPSAESQRACGNTLLTFKKPDCPDIDVHWTIVKPDAGISIDADELWKRSQPAAINGVPISVLAREDLLLHLCLHGGHQHGFGLGLSPLCDITETLTQYQDDLDWQAIVRRACRWGVQKCVYFGLRLSHELLGAPVPQEALTSLEPDDDGRWMELILKQVLRHDDFICPTMSISPRFAQLRGSRRLRDKVALALRRAFPSRQEMACLYCIPSDSPRIYPYYLIRLKDLTERYVPVVWRTVRRDPQIQAAVRHEISTAAIRHWLATARRDL